MRFKLNMSEAPCTVRGYSTVRSKLNKFQHFWGGHVVGFKLNKFEHVQWGQGAVQGSPS